MTECDSAMLCSAPLQGTIHFLSVRWLLVKEEMTDCDGEQREGVWAVASLMSSADAISEDEVSRSSSDARFYY